MNLDNFERFTFKCYIFSIVISALILCGSSTPEPNAVPEPIKEPAVLDKTYEKRPNDSLYDTQGQEVFKTDSDSSESVLHTDNFNVESNLFGDNDSIEHVERRKVAEDALF